MVDPVDDHRTLIGRVADERLLDQDPAVLAPALGRPAPIPPRAIRGRVVGVGVTMTAVALIGGIVLAIAGAVELLFEDAGALAVVALVLGVLLAATHWGWAHVAEISAQGLERRANAGIVDDRRRWLAGIAPFTRYEISTRAGDDGSITIERIRHRPVPTGERTFAFQRTVQDSEVHSGDEPAAVVAERAELLRRAAAADTERERERFQREADEHERSLLDAGETREHARVQTATAQALSEQINANLRDPPLTE